MLSFSVEERRVLGVLVEKGYTTPDQYPLTLNAIVTGSNQKTCRDPLMQIDEVDAFEALDVLRQAGLALCVRSSGSRTDRYRHCVPDQLEIDAKGAAVLAELLLRGPQSDGELRQHASRMVPIRDLATLQSTLEALEAKSMVRRLGPPGKKRGTRYAHTLYPEGEEPSDSEPAAHAPQARPAAPASGEVGELRQRLAALEARVNALEERLRTAP